VSDYSSGQVKTDRTVRSCLQWIEQYLSYHNEINPRLAAQWLLSAATGYERIELYMHIDQPLTDSELAILHQVTARRIAHEPLQYITGKTAFRYLELTVKPGVLIPRPETEVLVELVLARRPKRVLDIGCGSGAIALALLHELPGITVVATDISVDAVSLTEHNASELGLSGDKPAASTDELSGGQRLTVLCDDLATGLLTEPENHGSFDVVVSNPPYIPSSMLDGLPSEVRDHEPLSAIDGGSDGLDIYRRLLVQAALLLKPGGTLAVELYSASLGDATHLAETAGFISVQTHRDLTGQERFLTCEQP
jgi:release factor glutamine methyltransferase